VHLQLIEKRKVETIFTLKPLQINTYAVVGKKQGSTMMHATVYVAAAIGEKTRPGGSNIEQ